MLLFVQLCALRASNGCKDDMGTLSWLNAETLCRSIYMWQSWVEIKHCSVVYFHHITVFEAL